MGWKIVQMLWALARILRPLRGGEGALKVTMCVQLFLSTDYLLLRSCT